MAQPSASHAVYTSYDLPPPPPIEEEPPPRCDACDRLIEGAPAGEGVYLWARGDEILRDPAPLCLACAVAIGVAAINSLEEEEEGG